MPIDPTNKQLVSSIGNTVMVLKQPIEKLTKEEALTFAAWLIVMADMTEPSDTRGYTLQDYIHAVKNT